MSGTRRTMIVRAFGQDFEYKTSGNYSYAAVIRYRRDGQDVQRVAAIGNSPASVEARAKRALRLARPGTLPSDYTYLMESGPLTEATAPVVRQYFRTHRVVISGLFREGQGWAAPDALGMVPEGRTMAAGRSVIRRLAREGWTGVAFTRQGRVADFQMTELAASMNARKAG